MNEEASSQSGAALQAWREWLLRARPDRDPTEDLEAVRIAAEAGLGTEQITALVHLRWGRATAAERLQVQQVWGGISTALGWLRTAPQGATREEIWRRWAAAVSLADAVAPAAGRGRPAPAEPRRPFSWNQFLSEHAIQLLGYSGAFLLGVAVLLFDLSGQSPSRFYALAALDLLLFGAAYVSARVELLRILSRAYTAMAAVLLPLTLVAAYVFLDLRAEVPVLTALALGGFACAVTYGGLALALGSRLYAWVTLLAVTEALFCGVQQPYRDGYAGAATAALGLILAAGTPRLPGVMREPGRWLARLLPAAGAVAVLVTQAANDPAAPLRASVPLTLSLALAVPAYTLAVRFSGRSDLYWAGAYAGTLTIASVAWFWEPSPVGWQWLLLGLAALNVVAGRVLPPIRLWQEIAGLALLALLIGQMGGDPGPEAAVFAAALVLSAAGAWRWQSQIWAAAAAVFLVIGWYWFGSALLPRPARATTSDLARLYTPVPEILLAAGAVRRRYLPKLRELMYAGFAATGVGVPALAAGGGDLTLAGAALVVYAVCALALVVWEGWPLLAAVPVLAFQSGCALLVAARTSEAGHFVLLLAAAAPLSLLAARSLARLRDPAWNLWPRYLGLAEAVAAAVAAGGLAWQGGSPGMLVEQAAAIVVAAGALAWEGLARRREGLYAAAIAASLLAIPIAVGVGLENYQWRLDPVGLVIVALGGLAAADARLAAPRLTALWLQLIGLATLLGLTAGQIVAGWGGPAQAPHTELLAVEAVLCLFVSVPLRSRWPAVAGGLGLVAATVSALFVLASQLPLSAVFGLLAAFLIVAATGLALLRGRLGQGAATRAWSHWL